VKLLMAVFMTIPFISIFIPGNFQWLFFIFPNYWMFQLLQNVIMGTSLAGFALTAPLTMGSGCLFVALLYPVMRKGLRLR